MLSSVDDQQRCSSSAFSAQATGRFPEKLFAGPPRVILRCTISRDSTNPPAEADCVAASRQHSAHSAHGGHEKDHHRPCNMQTTLLSGTPCGLPWQAQAGRKGIVAHNSPLAARHTQLSSRCDHCSTLPTHQTVTFAYNILCEPASSSHICGFRTALSRGANLCHIRCPLLCPLYRAQSADRSDSPALSSSDPVSPPFRLTGNAPHNGFGHSGRSLLDGGAGQWSFVARAGSSSRAHRLPRCAGCTAIRPRSKRVHFII